MFYLKAIAAAVVALAVWGAFVVFTTLNGWWHSPITSDSNPNSFMEAAKRVISEQNVGNVALVLIEGGAVYAEHFDAASQKIDRETIFPTASMSKWITALGTMTLVESGDIDLDAPISRYLTRWQLPPSEFPHDGVTVGRLLSHTSGLSDGLGFGDYAAEENVPSLEESLMNPRASSGRRVEIALGRTPGKEWDYSGGGYLILQLIIEEVTGQSFEGYMQAAVLKPLGMSRSTFGYIGEITNTTISYDVEGAPAPLYRYAASAATGFSSSVADMTKLVLALLDTNDATPLRHTTVADMREPKATILGADIWGLGTILYAPTATGDYVYGHDGQNEPALNAAVRINPVSHDAIIVFASGNPSLATHVGFEWVFWQTGLPDFLGIGYVIDRGVQTFAYGAIVILSIIVLIGWKNRRSRALSVG